MKFNYFDLGLFKGVELGWMVNSIFPDMNIQKYSAYGFEPCSVFYEGLISRFGNNRNITLLRKAVSGKSGKIKLFLAYNDVGNSIYETKKNVNKNDFELVDSIVFSEWIRQNVPDFESCFNIMKVNIEGAEWPLFKDLCETGLVKNINIFCGQGHDVEKIKEFVENGVVGEYYDLLDKHGIYLHRFTEHNPKKNVDMISLIKEKLDEHTFRER
tara:strand:+ start:3519 stop:4157 length:639 start_codon:yes stop_codon:yes gene_type:complete